jgi:chromosome partitioning protein
MTRILTVANQKGGVGKTTTTVNVAAALAQSGHRVLVVDLDPQGNASTALGIDHAAGVPDIYDVISDNVPLVDIVTECPDIPGLWGAPATVDLAGAEIELVGAQRREYRLKGAIEQYLEQQASEGTKVDYVLIDCPPSLGLLTLNGLVAAREVLLPIQCEYYALEGLSQLLRTVDMVAEHLNPQLHVSAIVLTMYDGRTRLASQVAYEVRTHFGARVLDTVVPRSVRVSEAPSYGLSVISYDPTNSGAIAYREVAEQLDAIGPGTSTLTAKETHG